MTTHAGEDHVGSKLDWQKVRWIREAAHLNDVQIASELGVDRTTVRLVRANATWREPDYQPRNSPGLSAS